MRRTFHEHYGAEETSRRFDICDVHRSGCFGRGVRDKKKDEGWLSRKYVAEVLVVYRRSTAVPQMAAMVFARPRPIWI